MIKFFRQIRFNLMETGKTSRYLKYAIGEIILVVIGILIALQINNWNENRKKQQKEQAYIHSLHNDLEFQIETINSQIESEEAFVGSAKHVLDVLSPNENKDFIFDKDFYTHLTNLLTRKTFRIIDATYADLLSTGDLGLISNTTIKNDIVVYFQDLERMESVIQNNNTDIIDDIFLPEVQKISLYHIKDGSLLLSDEIDISKYIEDFNPKEVALSSSLILEPKNNLRFKNILKQRLVVAVFHFNKLKEMRLNTERLKAKLETYQHD